MLNHSIENAHVYQGCFSHCIWHDKCLYGLSRQAFDSYRAYVLGEACLTSSDSEYKLLNIFEFIKAVSHTVFCMINTAYHDKPLILYTAGKRVTDT